MEEQEDVRPLDGLLSLFRRESFDIDLEEFSRAATPTRPLCLVMIDIDHFKAVNDTHGHPAADEVLQSIAALTRQCSLNKGSAYRYGGEELAVLLPNFSTDEGTSFAERLRRSIEAAVHGSIGIKVTASFGIACIPDHANDPSLLLRSADEALYEAKELGRNCVRVHGEPRPQKQEPRNPSRKQPEPGRLTERQMQAIRLQYFRQGGAQCPNDQAWLTVKQSHQYGFKTPDLFILCGVCGLNMELPGEEA